MYPARTRHSTTIAITAAAVALAIATAAPASADPGNGNGNGATNSNAPSQPPGQAKKTDPPVMPTATTASPAPVATHVPPGQAKKAAAPPKGKGHSNAGAQSKAGTTGRGSGAGNGKANRGNGANGPSGHNPPGNNGTVKVHALAGDPGHHNVAHPGCSFVVDFWGFDAGQTLNVSFAGQAPTGAGTPLTLSGSGTSITSPDDAGGGKDPDGELVFTPTAAELSVLGAPAHEGYHVRLTVATGQGGGKKQKVFWISPCAPATPTTSTPSAPSQPPTLSIDTPTVVTDSDTVTAVRIPDASVPRLDTARFTRSASRIRQASPPVASLPFTGANVSDVIVAGLMTLAAGVVLTVAARRRRRSLG